MKLQGWLLTEYYRIWHYYKGGRKAWTKYVSYGEEGYRRTFKSLCGRDSFQAKPYADVELEEKINGKHQPCLRCLVILARKKKLI